jgi:hypothetical protein
MQFSEQTVLQIVEELRNAGYTATQGMYFLARQVSIETKRQKIEAAQKLELAPTVDARLKDYHLIGVARDNSGRYAIGESVVTTRGLNSVSQHATALVSWAFPSVFLGDGLDMSHHFRGVRVALSTSGVGRVHWDGGAAGRAEMWIHKDKDRAERHLVELRAEAGRNTFDPARKIVQGLVRKT